jgi:hypothetical protein
MHPMNPSVPPTDSDSEILLGMRELVGLYRDRITRMSIIPPLWHGMARKGTLSSMERMDRTERPDAHLIPMVMERISPKNYTRPATIRL